MKNKVKRETLIKRDIRKMIRKLDKWDDTEINVGLRQRYAFLSDQLGSLSDDIGCCYPAKRK